VLPSCAGAAPPAHGKANVVGQAAPRAASQCPAFQPPGTPRFYSAAPPQGARPGQDCSWLPAIGAPAPPGGMSLIQPAPAAPDTCFEGARGPGALRWLAPVAGSCVWQDTPAGSPGARWQCQAVGTGEHCTCITPPSAVRAPPAGVDEEGCSRTTDYAAAASSSTKAGCALLRPSWPVTARCSAAAPARRGRSQRARLAAVAAKSAAGRLCRIHRCPSPSPGVREPATPLNPQQIAARLAGQREASLGPLFTRRRALPWPASAPDRPKRGGAPQMGSQCDPPGRPGAAEPEAKRPRVTSAQAPAVSAAGEGGEAAAGGAAQVVAGTQLPATTPAAGAADDSFQRFARSWQWKREHLPDRWADALAQALCDVASVAWPAAADRRQQGPQRRARACAAGCASGAPTTTSWPCPGRRRRPSPSPSSSASSARRGLHPQVRLRSRWGRWGARQAGSVLAACARVPWPPTWPRTSRADDEPPRLLPPASRVWTTASTAVACCRQCGTAASWWPGTWSAGQGAMLAGAAWT